jgi:hypothetical protein
MTESLRWVELDRQSLPGLVAEGEFPVDASHVLRPTSDGKDVFVGLLADDRASRPLVAVLNERAAREILAWLATYSPASFPITQSMRIITTEDLSPSLLSTLETRRASDGRGYWPSIVFGELLGQGEHISNVDVVALSRANACFSFTQARSDGLHGANSPLAIGCSRRLRTLENDRLFVKRSISVEELSHIWAWPRSNVPESSIQRELSQLVEDAVNGRLSETAGSHSRMLNSVGFDALLLGSGAIEARVRAYQSFVQSLESVGTPEVARTNAMFLAAAAICVGNGTSHISLLEDFGKRVPSAYAWFGLFAAIVGPKGWDPSWNRAINSMCRVLGSRFELTDPPLFDLSWAEYDFVREVPKPAEFVRHVPKFYPRSLSVEVVPGATCQLRLTDDLANARPTPTREEIRDSAARRETRSDPIPAQVAANLYEAERVLSHGHALLRQAIMATGARVPDQVPMFDGPSTKPRKRPSKKGSKSG